MLESLVVLLAHQEELRRHVGAEMLLDVGALLVDREVLEVRPEIAVLDQHVERHLGRLEAGRGRADLLDREALERGGRDDVGLAAEQDAQRIERILRLAELTATDRDAGVLIDPAERRLAGLHEPLVQALARLLLERRELPRREPSLLVAIGEGDLHAAGRVGVGHDDDLVDVDPAAGRRELRHLRREDLEHLLEAARLALQVRRVVLLDVPPGRLPERVTAGEEEGIPDVRWRLHALGGAGL